VIAGVRDPISKVAGAGIGSLLVFAAYWLDFSAETRFRIAAVAPFVGGFVSALGLPLQRALFRLTRYIDALLAYRRLKQLARNAPDDAAVQKRFQEARNIFAEAWTDKVRRWGKPHGKK